MNSQWSAKPPQLLQLGNQHRIQRRGFLLLTIIEVVTTFLILALFLLLGAYRPSFAKLCRAIWNLKACQPQNEFFQSQPHHGHNSKRQDHNHNNISQEDDSQSLEPARLPGFWLGGNLANR